MAEGGKSSVNLSLFKQGYPQQAAHNHMPSGFKDLQAGRLQNSSGQPVPVLRHQHSKEVFPGV